MYNVEVLMGATAWGHRAFLNVLATGEKLTVGTMFSPVVADKIIEFLQLFFGLTQKLIQGECCTL